MCKLRDDKMVDMVFITELTGLSDKRFYKLIKDARYPESIKLGHSSRWLKSEIEASLEEKTASSRG